MYLTVSPLLVLLWPGPGRRITDIIAKKISYIGSGLTCDWSEF